MSESNCWLRECFVFCERSLVRCKMLREFLPRGKVTHGRALPANSQNNLPKSCGRTNVAVALSLCPRGASEVYVNRDVLQLRVKEPHLKKKRKRKCLTRKAIKRLDGMCVPQDFICSYLSPAEGDLEVWLRVFPRRLRWWEEPSGPRQSEITPSLWSCCARGHCHVATTGRGRRQTVDESVETARLYVAHLPQYTFICPRWG